MAELNMLERYPKAKRDITKRMSNKTPENVATAKEFGEAFFDGSRDVGYGGYTYDGRWLPIAEDFVNHYGLKPGMRVLDVGCAKGFLVKDLMQVCPGLEVFGLDISPYAVQKCEPEVVGRIHVGNAHTLPFPNKSMDLVISINTIHNLNTELCGQALREISRVSKGPSYVQVDAYRTDAEKQILDDWVLTAETYMTPENWESLFTQNGYGGDYYWTIMTAD